MTNRVLALLFLATVLVASATAQDASVAAEGVDWKPFTEAVDVAEQQNKKLVVDIYAPWCPWCRRLQQEVYTDSDVQQRLADHFIATRLDGENQADSLQFREYTLTPSELAQGFGAQGYPTTVFLDSEGQYITRLPGFVDATEFTKVLTYVGSDAFKNASYQDFLNQTNE